MAVQATPFGPALPAKGWVPAPRYAMRRAEVRALMEGRPIGRILEVGCGSGALLSEFAAEGFTTTGLETSGAARELAAAFAANDDRTTVLAEPDASWSECFDYLFSFEVLEHIEDDVGALCTWSGWLRPGGVAIISVPAHMRLWGPSDVYAGHYRRYSRNGVEDLLARAGFHAVLVQSYGFPLSNLLEPWRNSVHARRLRDRGELKLEQATARSGIERELEGRLFPLMANPPGRQAFQLALLLQRCFRSTDLGTGYLAVGRKPPRS
jgi:SAM-dependent methyltransferase